MGNWYQTRRRLEENLRFFDMGLTPEVACSLDSLLVQTAHRTSCGKKGRYFCGNKIWQKIFLADDMVFINGTFAPYQRLFVDRLEDAPREICVEK
jgi:hypothetical protein